MFNTELAIKYDQYQILATKSYIRSDEMLINTEKCLLTLVN